MSGFSSSEEKIAYSCPSDQSISTCCRAWTQIFTTFLAYVLLISFPASYMTLIASAVLYLTFKAQFLIWFLFYQANVNFLLLSSVSLPLLSLAKSPVPKVMPFLLSIRIFYRTSPPPAPEVPILSFTEQQHCKLSVRQHSWMIDALKVMSFFCLLICSHPPELRVSAGTCHGN